MPIRVALNHVTEYRYDRPVTLGPQVVRLRPAPHCRTPIEAYSLKIDPATHFINWQQDPHGNFLARLVFLEQTTEFRVAVDLVANMTVVNPFDFFIEEDAEQFPFVYDAELAKDLKPFLEKLPPNAALTRYLREVNVEPRRTVSFLVDLNTKLQQDIKYLIRMEPGVQTPEETLTKRSGSCRDSAWLLAQILRCFGLASRFVSGYLIQLAPDIRSLDGPSGPTADFTDLHAWTEVYIPGAGWVGLDPTSGLFTGEGHIPLAATPAPQTAAPISGGVDQAEVEFNVHMAVTRVHEDPRVTKPYTEEQWARIDAVGHAVDQQLQAGDVRLTMGGEPTFVSIDDMEGAEWTVAAVGPMKQRLSDQLIRRLRDRFSTGAMLHFGQGKWYPGESLPRWAYTCLWRKDGEPIWNDASLLADVSQPSKLELPQAESFALQFAKRLDVSQKFIQPAYEDLWHVLEHEQKLPVDVEPLEIDPDDTEDRRRLRKTLERGVNKPVGYVLPLMKAWWQASGWASGPWPLRSEKLYLIPGDSSIGLRLPIDSLPRFGASGAPMFVTRDPLAPTSALSAYVEIRRAARSVRLETESVVPITQQRAGDRRPSQAPESSDDDTGRALPEGIIRTAMCIEPRDGRLHVFMPPTGTLEDYLELVAAVELTAEELKLKVVIEGYLPPPDDRISLIKVTPDPGVIEVNIHPAADWEQLKEITTGVYEEARLTRLGTEKFQLDGRHSGTGGGNHIVMGGRTPADSPFLRRPDLLRSLVCYWNNHPSLSYLFSSLFIGPTSQAPRVDEGRRDAMYELEIACRQIADGSDTPMWLVDRALRHLLVDLTGNTHRAEFCIDKLYSPDSSTGRLGLVELRAFEMPPHSRMSLAQQLLVRGIVAMFWNRPYHDPLIHWETQIHDRFMLPYYLERDFQQVLGDLREAGFAFEDDWFTTHIEFRCPLIGEMELNGLKLDLHQAIEPWYVLGEEPGGGGTTRYVDSSVERLQARVSGLFSERYTVAVNGIGLPLQKTDTNGQYIAGVRYRAWQPPSCLHPTIPVHTPLVFDIVDVQNGRSLGGCRYHIDHPGGLNPGVYPINALEAESRRAGRFFRMGHTGGPLNLRTVPVHPDYPCTLDLRRT